MALANLYQHNHAVFLNDPGHAHTLPGYIINSISFNYASDGSQGGQAISTGTNSATTGITVRDTAGGGGTANQTATTGSATPTPMRTVAPTLIAECVVRVVP